MRPNIPQLVYNLALERNLPALRELQAEGHCLTQFHHEFHHEFNAIAKLAFDGHGDAAEFLVDQLIGCVDDLVSGYAHAGNVARAKFWLPHNYDKTNIIIGFAYSNQTEALDDIIKVIQDSRDKYSLMLDAVFGYAKGGHESQLDSYKVNLIKNILPRFKEEQLNEASACVSITKRHFTGLAASGNLRGLELTNGNDVHIQMFYAFLKHKTPITNTLQSSHRFQLNRTAAIFGDDLYIQNHLLIAENDAQQLQWDKSIQNAYLIGGHTTTNGISLLNVNSVEYYCIRNHFSHIEKLLNHPNDDSRLAKSCEINGPPTPDSQKYHESSPYQTIIDFHLSSHPETRARQLLQIHDDKKRERLVWLGLGKQPDIPSEATPESNTIEFMHRVFTHSPLGFNIAYTIGHDQALLLNALGFIMISLHEAAGALNTSLVFDLILSNLLGVTEPDAVKIHSHFAGIFSKHINRLSNPQNTLTQGNDTHAPQHPAAGL